MEGYSYIYSFDSVKVSKNEYLHHFYADIILHISYLEYSNE